MNTDKSIRSFNLPPDVYNKIEAMLTVLEEQLTQHAEHEQHYPEIEEIFDGFRNYVNLIRSMINCESIRAETGANQQQSIMNIEDSAVVEIPEHPLIYSDDDKSLLTGIDILNRVKSFVNLLRYVDVGEETGIHNRDGGLSRNASGAFHQVLQMISESVDFVAELLELNRKETDHLGGKVLGDLNDISDRLKDLIAQCNYQFDAAEALLNTEACNLNNEVADGMGYTFDNLKNQIEALRKQLKEVTESIVIAKEALSGD